MSGFLLDTNVLSVFSRSEIPPHPHVRRWLESAPPGALFTSVLTFGEIRKGIELLAPGRRRTELERWLDVDLQQWFGTRLLPITHAISNRWGILAAQAQRRGRPLGNIDGLLAATAFEHRLSTITRRLAAIVYVHRVTGQDSPGEARAVRELLSGMRRMHGVVAHGKEALLSDDLRAVVRQLGDSLRDERDRALLLVGFAGAFRRSELVSIQLEDIQYMVEGLVIQLRRSKSDQEGEGREVPIPFGSREETCPVNALRRWVARAGIQSGPVFRGVTRYDRTAGKALTPTAVALIVKQRATAAGLDAAAYSGHSLRAGFATSAALGGAPEWAIMKQTGHRSRAMLDRYVRVASRFRSNAVSFTGL